jgi:hypothetical protein
VRKSTRVIRDALPQRRLRARLIALHMTEGQMEPTSRRQFLKRSSAVAAAAGVAAAVPAGAAHALTKPDANAVPRLPDDESVDLPVIAHVRDVRKGLVSLYIGEKEITIKDRRLAASLFHATR